ncbi:hypothetical protein [Lactobacillus xujianguonis]|nr:hypothetical protein [Lactobacillus xujianguonis]
MSSKANPISHDKNGRKVFADSIVLDKTATEIYIPVKCGGLWGDEFMSDFYPLDPASIEVIKPHATMKDLQKLMRSDKYSGYIFNTSGDSLG